MKYASSALIFRPLLVFILSPDRSRTELPSTELMEEILWR